MSKHRLVALGDILGFKETILNTPLEVVLTNHLTYVRKVLKHTIGDLQGIADVEDIAALKRASGIGFEWFSDTILLYTKQDTPRAHTAVIATAAWLVFELMYHAGVRIRFGIDYGELHTDENAGYFVGKALVGAYEMERHQNWVGGALTPNAMKHLHSEARFYVADYAVPVKKNAFETNAALNWTLGVHHSLTLPYSSTRSEPNEDDRRDNADVVLKWQETRAFHRAVCTRCR